MSRGSGERDRGAECGDDQVEGFAGDVALENPQNLVAAVALERPFRCELPGNRVVDESVVSDGPQGVVRGPVTTTVEAVALSLTTAGLHRAGAAECRGRGVARQPV